MSKKKKKQAKKLKKPETRKGETLPRNKEDQNRSQIKKERKFKKTVYLLLIAILIGSLGFFLLRPKYSVYRNSLLNVLLFTLDTTRADRLGCYGYAKAETPCLDELAGKGVLFANAYCQVPLTSPSHSSLFTSTYPLTHQVRSNGFYYLSPSFETLAEVLKSKGFKTAAFVSSFTLDSRFGFDQGFDFYDDTFEYEEFLKSFRSERTADKTSASFLQWLEKNEKGQFFVWIHYFDPHLPYSPPSPFKEKFAAQPYDGEIAFMDFNLGRVISKLKEKNILDQTLIICVGDHGEALGEKNEVDHGLFIYDVSLRVPLIFYAEKQLPRGVVIPSRVRVIDVMPTILDLLKIKPPTQCQGISLVSHLKGKKQKDLPTYIETYMPREYYGWSELIGIIDGPYKYIRAPRPEIYNLHLDPEETKNLYQPQGQLAVSMEQKLNSLVNLYSSSDSSKTKTLTMEEQEKLSSLGYIGTQTAAGSSQKALPDPKDKTAEYSVYVYGKKYEYEGNYERAEEYYKKALEFSPEVAWNYVHLSLLYRRMGKINEAIHVLELGNSRLPNDLIILSRLASAYVRGGKLREAIEAARAVLRIDPHYFDALYILGLSLVNLGEWSEALGYLAQAREIEPENVSLELQYAFCLVANGRAAEATRIYERLKNEHPRDYRIYQDMAIMYESLHDFQQAREHMKQALDLNPYFETYFNYAILLYKIGDLQEAAHYLKLYLETTPEKDTPRKKTAQETLLAWKRQLERR